MDAFSYKLPMLHLILHPVKLDQFNHAIHESLPHGFIHFTLDSLKADLPKSSPFGPQEVCPVQHQENVAESLHPHAERYPKVFEKVEKFDSFFVLHRLGSHLFETSLDNFLDLVLDMVAQGGCLTHLAETRDIAESGLFRNALRFFSAENTSFV